MGGLGALVYCVNVAENQLEPRVALKAAYGKTWNTQRPAPRLRWFQSNAGCATGHGSSDNKSRCKAICRPVSGDGDGPAWQ